MLGLLKSITWVSLVVAGLGIGGLISEEIWMQPLCFIPSMAYVAWADGEGKKAFFSYVGELFVMGFLLLVIFSVPNLPPEQGLIWFFCALIIWSFVQALLERRSAISVDGEC